MSCQSKTRSTLPRQVKQPDDTSGFATVPHALTPAPPVYLRIPDSNIPSFDTYSIPRHYTVRYGNIAYTLSPAPLTYIATSRSCNTPTLFFHPHIPTISVTSYIKEQTQSHQNPNHRKCQRYTRCYHASQRHPIVRFLL